MEFQTLDPHASIALFVKAIMVFEETATDLKTILPFFADGHPGLMFHQTENGLLVNPHDKQMPLLFLYGQTIKPIELVIDGPYKLVVFQLHPFVLKSFFDVSAQEINDGCFDLQHIENGAKIISLLVEAQSTQKRIDLITGLLSELFLRKKETLDMAIGKAIQLIIERKGQLNIRELCDQLHLTPRTLERRFLKEVGISAKQFSQMNQFQESLQQLTLKEFTKLSDIVYANGFADQSHFIRVFKAFTGKTPRKFTPKE